MAALNMTPLQMCSENLLQGNLRFASCLGQSLYQSYLMGKLLPSIPERLKSLEIKGCLITIDAMGCQKKMA